MRSTKVSRNILAVIILVLVAGSITFLKAESSAPGSSQPTILYGAAYYNEYMPASLQPGRLEKDVALMKDAGITVVRMGESTWSLWEPPTTGSSMNGWTVWSRRWARQASR